MINTWTNGDDLLDTTIVVKKIMEKIFVKIYDSILLNEVDTKSKPFTVSIQMSTFKQLAAYNLVNYENSFVKDKEKSSLKMSIEPVF